MKIAWILYLTVCSNINCTSQIVGIYNTLEQCNAEKSFYESIPKDSTNVWDTVKYNCSSLDYFGNKGKDI